MVAQASRRRGNADVTEDALFGGTLRFRQPASGYRVNVDAILLAAFASVGRRAALCVDLGAGVGAIALALHHLGAVRELALVDREADLCTLARENLLRVGAEGTVYRVDLEHGLPEPLSQAADLVVANPPFFDPEHHRPSQDRRRERARMGTVSHFTLAAARALSGAKARALFAYPARALAELVNNAREAGLVPKRLRFVHARKDDPARIALVEFRRARPGGLVVEPPLFEWQAPKIRSEEIRALLGRPRDAKRAETKVRPEPHRRTKVGPGAHLQTKVGPGPHRQTKVGPGPHRQTKVGPGPHRQTDQRESSRSKMIAAAARTLK